MAVVLFDATITAVAVAALPMILVGILTSVAMGQVVSGLAPTAGVAVMGGQLLDFALLFVTDMILAAGDAAGVVAARGR